MKPIPYDLVENTWRAVSVMAPEEAQKSMQAMGEEQPMLLAYLMAAEDENFNEEERGLFVYIGFVVWRIMSEGGGAAPVINEERIERAEAGNLKMLEYLEGETEADFAQTVETLSNSYNQREVLRYVVEALMEEPEEGEFFREENKGLAMLHLKTVIDCLDQSSPGIS